MTPQTDNMHEGKPHFKVYSSPASQWAGVPLLGLVEKGYPDGEYEVEDVDLRKSKYSHIYLRSFVLILILS